MTKAFRAAVRGSLVGWVVKPMVSVKAFVERTIRAFVLAVDLYMKGWGKAFRKDEHAFDIVCSHQKWKVHSITYLIALTRLCLPLHPFQCLSSSPCLTIGQTVTL